MISGLLKKIFGSRNDRLIKQYSAAVRQINALEPGVSALSDDELRSAFTTLQPLWHSLTEQKESFRLRKII